MAKNKPTIDGIKMDYHEKMIETHHQAFECDWQDESLLFEILLAAYSVTRNVHIVRPETAKAEKIEHVPASLRESIGQLRRALEDFEYATERNAEVGCDSVD